MYFLFHGKYYEQVHGAAMCSPISSHITNLFIQEFKVKAISSAPTPHPWLRYVDHTFVIQQVEHTQQLLQHINSQDPHIQYITKEPNQDGSLPFLDTLFLPDPDNTLTTTVHRKPMHADQYLHWDTYHSISAKNSVLNTLVHRARVICTNQSSLQQENSHIRKALLSCMFSSGYSTVSS